MPDKKGVALLPHLKKVQEAQGGKVPAELQEYYDLYFPVELSNYWEDFLEINKKRTRGESGDNPLTFLEIDAWARLTNAHPTQLWLDIIDMLDHVWLKVQAKKQQ